ncbi:MAG: histidinol-phosphate transaminase [Lachnospiraceae bacterium]|nr:histidinol-phosphate transaminase [Lachnospiraceae bacterium]
MLKHKDMFHGSDLEKVEAIYGIKKEDITSFSANVNPIGIPDSLKAELAANLDCVTAYPERDYAHLRKAIAEYTGTEPEYVLTGNGSTELLSLFIETSRPKKALILGPTYSEYEREVTLAGGSTSYYPLEEKDDFRLDTDAFCSAIDDETDLVIICNPNNPTSSAVSRPAMRKILDVCLRKHAVVLTDETYAEFAEDKDAVSSIPLCGSYDNLIVIRGTSKFFACPGLRLGYGVTGSEKIRRAVTDRQNPWSTNSLAELAGRTMFKDQEFISRTKELLSSERSRMIDILSTWPEVKVYPANANFLLFRIEKEGVTAQELFEHCIQKGLMIRNCASFPFLDERYVRFCFMMPEDNDRLLSAMREYFDTVK